MSVHSKAPNPDKGARYLSLLDQALCNGSWDEISELARKVDKHAPSRKCLTLAARAESQVATASHRPTSASSGPSVSIHSLGETVPRLIEAITSAQNSHPEDAYIASICLAEIHWLREAPLEALKVLSDSGGAPKQAKGTAGLLGWLEVCAVKASFIEASCLNASGRQSESRACYQSAAAQTPGYRSPELRRWTERLLARACMFGVKKMPSPSLQDFAETYTAFKAWGEFWQRAPSSQSAGATRLDVPRRTVWKGYYDLLSTLLQQGLLCSPNINGATMVLPSADVPEPQRQAIKQRQRAEMKRVEATYESLLLEQTLFPKASQTNKEVEDWTEQVMLNWRIFSGLDWTASDLGEGGKRNVSRGVLDILYRAATKTFHSTPILRHLFTVHAARGEFDLAMHAFDSYIDIVDKGKARAQKTGKHEIGHDDDDTALLAAAEAIRVLCRYGDRDQVEKAVKIGNEMHKWLEMPRPSTLGNAEPDEEIEDGVRPTGQPTSSLVKSQTLAATYRAIGISQAHWALLTFEYETRSSLLAEANNNLRRAHKFDEDSLDTAHALALVLAEMRDVSGALDVIRTALATRDESTANGNTQSSAVVERQRRLVPLWHLLALCLTAEDEFEAAGQMCEAAYKQFGDFTALFGAATNPSASDSEKIEAGGRGIVDQMDSCERESLLQVKMTQMALFELTEGPDDAVDLTDELLSLYSRLYGKPEQVVAEIAARPPPTSNPQASPRRGGTLRSIAGSIRPKSVRSTRSSFVEKDGPRRGSVISENGSVAVNRQDVRPTTNGSTLGSPIAITVTNEDGVRSAEKPHHKHPHLPHLPFTGRHRSASKSSRSPARSIVEEENEAPDFSEKQSSSAANNDANEVVKPGQSLGDMAHNAPQRQWPEPVGHDEQPPHQDVRLPAPRPTSSSVPEPQLSSVHERRHKVGVLVKTWLFSAELYIRADILDDAENLINDATKLTESLEIELAKSEDGTNAQRLFNKGWGSGKSVDELWADVWSTKARLASGRERPYVAMAAYEQALSHFPDHASSTIGLSNLLMDIYEEKLPAEEPLKPTHPLPTASGSLIHEAKPVDTRPTLSRPNTSATLPPRRPSVLVEPELSETKERKVDPSPVELNRLAARDRAYMLLSNLTKQGAGWDDSEAWLTLARAHELSREIGKAKQALWWVVELENNRPIRPWKEASPGGCTV